MKRRPPSDRVSPSSDEKRNLRPVRSAVGVHLIEQEDPGTLLVRATDENLSHSGVGERTVKHLRGPEQHVRRRLRHARPCERHLSRSGCPQAAWAHDHLDTALKVRVPPDDVLWATLRAPHVRASDTRVDWPPPPPSCLCVT